MEETLLFQYKIFFLFISYILKKPKQIDLFLPMHKIITPEICPNHTSQFFFWHTAECSNYHMVEQKLQYKSVYCLNPTTEDKK